MRCSANSGPGGLPDCLPGGIKKVKIVMKCKECIKGNKTEASVGNGRCLIFIYK